MTDTDLASAIKQGDNRAFKLFFNKYYKAVVHYVMTLTHELPLAEDIAQQAFITFWSKRGDLDIRKSVKNYIYTIAHNMHMDHLRAAKREDAFFDTLREHALRESIEEDRELIDQRIEKLKHVIDTLPERCRDILHLNKVEGLRYKDIADKLDISQKTVEAQMRIAYIKIREAFENDPLFLVFIRQVLATTRYPH